MPFVFRSLSVTSPFPRRCVANSNAFFSHELFFHGSSNTVPSRQPQHCLHPVETQPSDITLSFSSFPSFVSAPPSLWPPLALPSRPSLWNVFAVAFVDTVDTPSPFDDIVDARIQLSGLVLADSFTP